MPVGSFDIEIADVIDIAEGEDLDSYAPFHVSVAAFALADQKCNVWWTRADSGQPAPEMNRETAREVLGELRNAQRADVQLFAWNGAGFDVKWLGYAADDLELACEIALDLYDPMLQFFSQRGFPVSLEAVASAMHVPLRKLMASEDAPRRWRDGDHASVMKYVCHDVKMTNAVVLAIMQAGRVDWITRKGDVRSEPMPKLKTVREVIGDPLPDQSWMDEPIPRRKFVGWIESRLH